MAQIAALVSALMISTASLCALADDPRVEIKTTAGTIVVELYPDKAPKTVQNFLEYVKDGYYSGTIFHRVIRGFMIQGGGFDKTFKEKMTRGPIANEASNGLKNDYGTLAMARTQEPDSATAQFFINAKDNDFLNYRDSTRAGIGYTVFGKVVSGTEVVTKIEDTPVGPAGPFPTHVPQTTVMITSARILGTAEPAKK